MTNLTIFDVGATVMVRMLDRGISYWHYGIADGRGNVIHCSKAHKKVVIETENEFSCGRRIFPSPSIIGKDTFAYDRALRFVGAAYDLFQSNCEHFVRMCNGLDVESTQVQKYLIACGASAMVLIAPNPAIKAVFASVALACALTPSEKSPIPYAALAIGITSVGIAAVISN
ncbi:hypothetical protein FT643_09260 [Ketobacter sp. MCCC 1A13808]|uniref:hypothetical protein n=1 Tax=Ketobacter sp. MCCC 1A13808 TaxID=2602738 RepID=UPI0012EBBE48|nr:hypothetical protein [Ketobacter sp. MCCC 1A13808]MVF12332.1 hypothetical protein [Ketobacter sp. MCCC 1A13808]